jgi:hypothetical protein
MSVLGPKKRKSYFLGLNFTDFKMGQFMFVTIAPTKLQAPIKS